MKKKMMIIVALLMCLTVGSASAVLVSDSFDNHADGADLVTVSFGVEISALSPDVGPSPWTRYVGQAQGSPVISSDVAYAGTQSLKHTRPVSGGVSDMVTVGAGPLSVGQYILTGAINPLNSSSSGNFALTTDAGAFITALSTNSYSGGSAAHYTQILDDGAYAIAYKDPTAPGGGGIYLTPGEWNQYSLVLDVVDAGGGLLGGTATLLYNQGGVDYVSSSGSFGLSTWTATDNVNLFTSSNRGSGPAEAVDSVVYWDEVSLSAVPEPATITLLGLGLVGLLRKKRS